MSDAADIVDYFGSMFVRVIPWPPRKFWLVIDVQFRNIEGKADPGDSMDVVVAVMAVNVPANLKVRFDSSYFWTTILFELRSR